MPIIPCSWIILLQRKDNGRLWIQTVKEFRKKAWTPFYQSQSNVYLQPQMRGLQWTGYSKFLNLRSWPLAQVTFTIPTLIEALRRQWRIIFLVSCSRWFFLEAGNSAIKGAHNLQSFSPLPLIYWIFCVEFNDRNAPFICTRYPRSL